MSEVPPVEGPPEAFPAADVGVPMSGAGIPARPPRRGRRALAVLAAFFVVSGLAGGGAYLLLQPKGPPEAPASLEAQPDLCFPPQCEVFTSTVTLTWDAPATGDPVTGYSVVRDGTTITARHLRANELSFVDVSAEMGEIYAYRVTAHSESGDSPASIEVMAELPTPALRLARLDGPYRLEIRVERATNLGRLEGIRNPKRGDHRGFEHRVYSSCGFGDAACPVSWNLHTRPLRPTGLAYRGSFVDITRARCLGGGRAPVRVRMSLRVTDAAIANSAWVVTAFTGTYTISFRCPGSFASVGTLSFRARA